MKVAIVKYNAGNVASVRNAISRLGVDSVVSDDAAVLRRAERVIFPGVGEASSAMSYLRGKRLDEVVRSLTQPVLGICLGMQLLCAYSEENDTECLGVFPGRIRRFSGGGPLKVPHMGWNTISDLRSPLLEGVKEDSYAYFVHGYYAERSPETIAGCVYGEPFAAGVQKDNFYAVQFHPEKSGEAGTQILKNFLNL
jgi:glutamine amidotransferase